VLALGFGHPDRLLDERDPLLQLGRAARDRFDGRLERRQCGAGGTLLLRCRLARDQRALERGLRRRAVAGERRVLGAQSRELLGDLRDLLVQTRFVLARV